MAAARRSASPTSCALDAWQAKAQQTGFGSYAELKHDTILYTKQAGGDTGGGSAGAPARALGRAGPRPAAAARRGGDAHARWPGPPRAPLGLAAQAAERLRRDGRAARAPGRGRAGRRSPSRRRTTTGCEAIGYRAGEPLVGIGRPHGTLRAGGCDDDAAIIADVMRGVDSHERRTRSWRSGRASWTASTSSSPTTSAASRWPVAGCTPTTSSPGRPRTG